MTELAALQAELEAAEAACAEAESVLRRLDSLRAARSADEELLVEARTRLGDERRDVAALESFSPTRIWATLRGSHATDLEREQAEVRAGEYAVAELEARLERLRGDELALGARAAELLGAPERRERALAAKEAALTAAGGAAGADLTAIAVERARLGAERTELEEALHAAAAASGVLAEASRVLGDAGGWATFDTFLGGGLLTDMAKYDRMDRANRLLRDADLALGRLSRELGDLGREGVAGPQVSGLDRTFDVWFDNIFSDWSVKNRIGEAAERTRRARAEVAEVHRSLTARLAVVTGELDAAAARRDALLRG